VTLLLKKKKKKKKKKKERFLWAFLDELNPIFELITLVNCNMKMQIEL
jgi:hypothetical protein